MESIAAPLATYNVAGLPFHADGDRLLVRGPQSAEAIARQLLTRKGEILASLSQAPPVPPASPEPEPPTTSSPGVRRYDTGPYAGFWWSPDSRPDPVRAEACRREAEEYQRSQEIWLKQFPATSPENTQKVKSSPRKKCKPS